MKWMWYLFLVRIWKNYAKYQPVLKNERAGISVFIQILELNWEKQLKNDSGYNSLKFLWFYSTVNLPHLYFPSKQMWNNFGHGAVSV